MGTGSFPYCVVCAEFKGSGPYYEIRKGKYVARTERFVLQPAIGALCEDYLIISPIEHKKSFSEVKQHEEIDLLLRFVKLRNPNLFWLLLEHGDSQKTVEHAHLHLIGLRKEDYMRYKGMLLGRSNIIRRERYEKLEEVFKSVYGKPEYYLLVDLQEKEFYILEPKKKEKEFIRKILSEITGESWRIEENPGRERIKDMLRRYGEGIEVDEEFLNTLEYYEGKTKEYTEKWKDWLPPFWERILRTVSLLRPEGPILDIGCGTGRDLEYLIRYRPTEPWCIEVAKGFEKIVKRRIPDVEFILGDIRNAELPKNYFSAVISVGMILHLQKEDVLRAFDKVREILKEGGIFLLSTKAGAGKYTRNGRTFYLYPVWWLEKELRKRGFKEVLRYWNPELRRDVWVNLIFQKKV